MLALLAGAGCQFRDIDLVVDDRVEIVEPADRSEVAAPFDIRWTARDLPIGTRFVLVIDGTPPPPGRGLDWYARDDDSCRPADGCPDSTYLARRNVFETEQQRHRVDALAPDPSAPPSRRDHHEATVFLLDADGRRIGEAAAHVEFRIRR